MEMGRRVKRGKMVNEKRTYKRGKKQNKDLRKILRRNLTIGSAARHAV